MKTWLRPQPNAQIGTRSIATCALALVAVIVLGLSMRHVAAHHPSWLLIYGPDALWTVAVYLATVCVAHRLRPPRALAIAYAISAVDELTQIYHAPWIDALRHTPPFGLLLGYGFQWNDLAYYAVGAVLAYALDMAALWHSHPAGHE